MPRGIISGIFCALLSSAVPAVTSQTLSVGYAQTKIEDVNNMPGVNLQYRYMQIHTGHIVNNMPGVNLQYRYMRDSPVSVVASFTILKNSEDSNSSFFQRHMSDHVSAKYYSLLAEPAYRLY